MRRFAIALTAVLAVAAFSTMGFAQATTPTKTAHAKTTAMTKSAPAKAAAMRFKGEGKYDEATKTLTVGDKTFTLAPDAKIMMGAKSVEVNEVTGKNVLVTYSVVDGKNVASKVTIAKTVKAVAKVEKREPATKK